MLVMLIYIYARKDMICTVISMLTIRGNRAHHSAVDHTAISMVNWGASEVVRRILRCL